MSVFELDKCSLHKNGVELKNKDNGTMIVGLMRSQTVKCGEEIFDLRATEY